MPKKLLSATLKKFRRQNNLTQKSVARRCSLSQSEWSRLENGEFWPHLGTLERILHKLKISDKDFYTLLSQCATEQKECNGEA